MKRWFLWINIVWLFLPMTVYAWEHPPDAIQVYYQKKPVLEHVEYDEADSFEIISDDSKIQVLIDEHDVPIVWEEHKGSVPFSKQAHHVQIVREKTIVKEFWIQEPKPIYAHAQFVSTTEGQWSLQVTFDAPIADEIYMLVQKEEQVIDEITCQNQKEILYKLQNGVFKVYLYDRQNPNHALKINDQDTFTFHFSETEPEIQAEVKEIPDSRDKELLIHWPEFVKEKSVIVDHMVVEADDRLILKATEGQQKTVSVVLKATDLFGRTALKPVDVLLDAKPPVLTLFHGQQPMMANQLYILHEKKEFTFFWDEPIEQQLDIYVNDQKIPLGQLNTIWQSLKNQDRLKLVCQGKDLQGNISSYLYEFQYQTQIETLLLQASTVPKKLEKVVQVQTKDPYFGSYLDSRSIWRTWKKNEDQKIILEKKEIRLQDRTKPMMRFMAENGGSLTHLQKGDVLRLTLLNTESYSDDHFTDIQINGKKMDADQIHKDALHNEYVLITLKDKETKIVASAEDKSGNTAEIQQTFTLEKTKFYGYWLLVIPGLLGIFGLFWKVKHGKTKGS